MITSSDRTRILVVANRTIATPRLLQELRRRARAGPCDFSLLVPDTPDRKAADWTLETAASLVEREVRAKVETIVGGADAFVAVQRALERGHFDEIIVSTPPTQRSKWRRRDLIRRIERLGLPVTAVVPRQVGVIEAIEESDEVLRSM